MADQSPKPDAQRPLTFHHLDDVLRHVHRLRDGHRTIGRWSLGQICRHLADSFNGSIDGFDTPNHRFMRWLLGRAALRKVFTENALTPGFTVSEKLNPPPNTDLDASARDLQHAIRRFQQHTGPLRVHPFFGRLTRDQWDRLHRIHCAHHLGFALPTKPADPES